MSVIKLLNKLDVNGSLRKLYKGGYVSPKVFTDMDVMNKYNALDSKLKKVEKVQKISSQTGISERQVYRILKKLDIK